MNENNCFEDNNREENSQTDELACENTDTILVPVKEEPVEGEANAAIPETDSEEGAEESAAEEAVSVDTILAVPAEPVIEEKKGQPAMGMAIASMILAIASHVFGGGLILSIIALVLAVTAQKKGNTTGFATAGKVIALICTILWSVVLVAFILIIVLAMLFAV